MTQTLAPLELYEFRLGSTSTYWRYTSGAEDVSYGGHTYSAVYLKRGDIEQSDNSLRNQLEIELQWETALVWQYRLCPWDDTVSLTLYRQDEVSGSVAVYWRGKVAGVRFQPGRIAKVTCSPLACDLERTCQALRYSRNCCVPLYSDRCGVNVATYTVSGQVSAVDGALVTADVFGTQADGWFIGGKLSATFKRKIIDHSGTTVRLAAAVPGMLVDDGFTATAGCLHTPACCHSRFNNRINIKAQPYIPTVNPFGGDAICY